MSKVAKNNEKSGLLDVDLEGVMQGYPKNDFLSREEEARIGSLPEDHPDRWKLVTHNMAFVLDFSLHFAKKNRFIHDGYALIAAMQDALIRASKRFKNHANTKQATGKNCKFLTYAVVGMRLSALDEAGRQSAPVKVPRWSQRSKHLLRKDGKYYHLLPVEDRETALEEIVEEHCAKPESVEPDEKIQDRELIDDVNRALGRIKKGGKADERGLQIIREYFQLDGGNKLTLQEMADQRGISKERLRQLKERALQQMKSPALRKHLEE